MWRRAVDNLLFFFKNVFDLRVGYWWWKVKPNLLALSALSLLFSAAGEAAEVVHMTDLLTFEPARLVINVGDVVEWQNDSLVVHTVTDDLAKAAKAESVELPSGAEAFDSGNLDHQEAFRHTFTVPGTYRYFCIPHEGAAMIGEIEVRGR
jgi:plastocyanin